MAVPAGHHRLGPDRGRILLRTYRDGLAARAGHDLVIEMARWSGELAVGEDLSPAALDVQVDMTSLTVLEGHGGLTPLTGRDRKEITSTARKVLTSDRYPQARFRADRFEPAHGGGFVSGSLTLHGTDRPLRLRVDDAGGGRYHATGSVTQSSYGIKPYTGFLGALRVRDAVDLDIEVDLAELYQAGR